MTNRQMHHARALANRMLKIYKEITKENKTRPKNYAPKLIPEASDLSSRSNCFKYVRDISRGRYNILGAVQDNLFYLRFYIKKHRLSDDIVAEAWNMVSVSMIMDE